MNSFSCPRDNFKRPHDWKLASRAVMIFERNSREDNNCTIYYTPKLIKLGGKSSYGLTDHMIFKVT